jgi:glycopeptide antibiotics resistance protein
MSGSFHVILCGADGAHSSARYHSHVQVQSKPDAVRNELPTWRTMTVFTKVGTVVIWVVFVLYLVFLLKLLLLSRPPGSERSLNLIPFATISDYLFSGSAAVKRLAIGNVIGNVVAFVPLGGFLPLLRRKTGIWTNLLIVVCASVAVEIIQGVFGLGASDIDDVILNTLGGLIGILFFTLLYVLLRRWSHVIAVMAVLSLLAVPILYYLLFAIRLRM